MSLASYYAHLLHSNGTASYAGKVVTYMKKKGHVSLLPQVARILARLPHKEEGTLTVARKGDVKKFQSRVEQVGGKSDGVRVVVDPSIVGGYIAQKGATLLDASYRRALVAIYQNVTGK